MGLTIQQHDATSPALPAIHMLIHSCFMPLNARIDPPSSVAHLSLAQLTKDAAENELFAIGTPPRACMILRPHPDYLYISKLSVAPNARRQGLAQLLLEHAKARATALGKPALKLQARIELTENHQLFLKARFHMAQQTTQDGFSRPTSITFRYDLS